MAKYGVLALACLLAVVSMASAANVTLVRVHSCDVLFLRPT